MLLYEFPDTMYCVKMFFLTKLIISFLPLSIKKHIINELAIKASLTNETVVSEDRNGCQFGWGVMQLYVKSQTVFVNDGRFIN